MKQRLLLSLLMLFVSVGLVKAADTPILIKIPAGEGETKISLTSTSGFSWNSGSYPHLNTGANTQEITPTGFGTSTITWTFEQNSNIQTYKLVTATNSDPWGDISIQITGAVAEFTINAGNTAVIADTDSKLLKQIKSLTLDNLGMTSLKIGTHSYNTDYLPNLSTLSCSGNKLRYVPMKGSIVSYNVGTQKPITEIKLAGNAKSFPLNVNKIFVGGLAQQPNIPTSPEISISKLTLGGKDVTSYAVPDDSHSIYHFINGDEIYQEGTYTANITVSKDNQYYPDVTIEGVILEVAKAEFTLTTHIDTEYSKEGNKVEVYKNGTLVDEENLKTTIWVRGDMVTIKPVPNTDKGYVFDGSLTAIGLDLKDDEFLEGNTYRYTVRGNVNPEITVGFKKANDIELVYNTADANGELTIYHEDGKTSIQKGEQLTVGQKIRVVAIANDGFMVDQVTLNGKAIDQAKDTDENDNRFDAIIEVPVKGCNIVAYFKTIGKKFTLDVTNGPETTVTGDNGKTYFKGVSGSTGAPFEKVIPAGTKLTFTMTLQPTSIGKKIVEKVVINGNTYDPEETEKGTFVVKDYVMPDAPVQATVYVKELKDITITLKKVTGTDGKAYNLIYNGDYQDVQYTLSPSDEPREGIQLLYRKGKDDTFSSETRFSEPNADGETYWVKFVRPADDTYQELGNASDEEFEFTIGKADLTLGTLPTVSVVDKKYKIEGGKIKIGNKELDATEYGTYMLIHPIDKNNITDAEADEDLTTIRVRYTLNDRGNALFVQPNSSSLTSNPGINDFNVTISGKEAATLTVRKYGNLKSSFIMKSGVSEIADGAEVLDGTTITFSLTPEVAAMVVSGQNEYHIYQVDANGNILDETTDYLVSGETYTINATNPTTNPVYFMLVNEDNRSVLALAESSELEQEVVYNEQVQEFDLSKIDWVTSDGEAIPDASNIEATLEISYELNGKAVSPKDANKDGQVYDVYFYRKASISHQEFPRVKVGTLKIKKADIDINKYSIPKPEASRVRLGQSLFYSSLEGKATIAGHYAWNESQAAENIKVEAGKTYKVKFVPDDSNYNDYTDIPNVEVPVTTQPVVTYRVMPENWGTIRVVNTDDPNLVYESGDEFIDGARLRVYVQPLNDDIEIENVVMCGHSFGSVDELAYEVTNVDEVVEIVAYFKPKTTTVVVPDGQYAVELPDAVRGAKITYSGEPIVERGNSFTFTVTTLAADVSKLRVTANGETLTRAANGSYTISNITKKQEVQITLSNPTEVKVNIPLIYHEKGQPTSGRVQIINNTSNDGKYYYNDELTLIAYPETGVEFDSWSDKNKDSVRDIVLDKAEISLQAVFKGTPVTGIEDIESAAITTGKGFIMVKNVANAKVTVVSISGRLQAQEEVSGDTRIDVPQGIYVVVLESGSDVKRVKVIVK